jgi:catechol 2,3-dioxygenase-like lactoylglutathione lyase family enzyme
MRNTALAALALLGCGKAEPRPDPLAEMAKHPHAELEAAIPIYRVDSLRAAQAYYRDKLGFKVEWDHGDPPDFGAVKRADFVLFICEQCQSSAGAWSMTFTKDVDKLYEDFVKRGAIIKMPPTNMPWDLREMHVADPDGNVIRFGSSIPH